MTTADTRHQLHLLRDHLGDLAAAMHTDPAPVWPPQRLSTEMWAQRDDQARAERAERTPDALGDSPAPIANLSALEAYEEISTGLLDLADQVAAACQRPPRHPGRDQHGRQDQEQVLAAQLDADDPRRWRYNASWAAGPHWAAVFVDGRLAGDDLDGQDDLFRPLPALTTDQVASTVRALWQRCAAVLGIGDHTDPVPRPCPWCGGVLMLRQPAGEAPYAWCRGGWDCSAPAECDQVGRPLWIGAHLTELHRALTAAAARADASELAAQNTAAAAPDGSGEGPATCP